MFSRNQTVQISSIKSNFWEILETKLYIATKNTSSIFLILFLDSVSHIKSKPVTFYEVLNPSYVRKKENRLVQIWELSCISVNSLLLVFSIVVSCWAKHAWWSNPHPGVTFPTVLSESRSSSPPPGKVKRKTGRWTGRRACSQTHICWNNTVVLPFPRRHVGESTPDGRGGRKEIDMSEEQNQIASSQFDLSTRHIYIKTDAESMLHHCEIICKKQKCFHKM